MTNRPKSVDFFLIVYNTTIRFRLLLKTPKLFHNSLVLNANQAAVHFLNWCVLSFVAVEDLTRDTITDNLNRMELRTKSE